MAGLFPVAMLAAGLAAAGTCLAAPVASEMLHTRLVSSVPADGDTLRTPLTQIRLLFSGPVSRPLSALVLHLPGGDSTVLALRSHPDSTELLLARLPPLSAGGHRLAWRTVSVDGHQVAGAIAFHVAREAAASESGEAGPEPEAVEEIVESVGAGSRVVPRMARVVLGWIGLAFLLGMAGLLWFTGSGPLSEEHRLTRAAAVLGIGAVVFLAVELLMWIGEVRPAGASGFSAVGAAFQTRTGQVEGARVVLAGLAFMFLAGAGKARLASALALFAAVLGGASGHSASVSPLVSVPANALHLGAASIWLGGLLLLVLCPATPTSPRATWTYRSVTGSVSAAALLAVLLIVVTGIVQTFVLLPDVRSLIVSPYGRLVLLKLLGLGALVGLGAYHRFRIIPAMDAAEPPLEPRLMRRTVRLETLVLVLVLFLAALLARISPPGLY